MKGYRFANSKRKSCTFWKIDLVACILFVTLVQLVQQFTISIVPRNEMFYNSTQGLLHKSNQNRDHIYDQKAKLLKSDHKELAAAVPTKQRPDGGAFVHIAKTGGSVLSTLLRNGCHSYVAHPCRNISSSEESMASTLINSYYHVPDFGLLPQSHHDFYIVSVRDPFERLVSAFTYEHIHNRIARMKMNMTQEHIAARKLRMHYQSYECFPTLEIFVQFLSPNPREYDYPYPKQQVNTESCIDLARAAFFGQVKIFHHLYFSYQKIKALLPHEHQNIQFIPTIFVNRQEHLWDDWRNINTHHLHQSTKVYIPQTDLGKTNSKDRNLTAVQDEMKLYIEPVNRSLTEAGQQILCEALKDDYDAYYWFLLNAKNLNVNDLEDALHRTKMFCPLFSLKSKLLS